MRASCRVIGKKYVDWVESGNRNERDWLLIGIYQLLVGARNVGRRGIASDSDTAIQINVQQGHSCSLPALTLSSIIASRNCWRAASPYEIRGSDTCIRHCHYQARPLPILPVRLASWSHDSFWETRRAG
jgi:hypothetical protein